MSEHLPFLLKAIAEGPRELTARQLAALIAISHAGKPMRSSDLAELLAIPKPSVTRTYQALRRAGLIQAERGKGDSRLRFLSLAPKGEAFLKECAAA